MSDQATDGSSDGGDPTHGQLDDGQAAPGYSTNANELFNYIGGQLSGPRRQCAQRDQAGRPDHGDVYEHRDYTERYERPQQPARSGVSRDSHPQQQHLNQSLQTPESSRRLEEQRLAERQLSEQRRQHEERLVVQRSTDRGQYPPKDPKSEHEDCQSRRCKPR
jgi:hypothetical protein